MKGTENHRSEGEMPKCVQASCFRVYLFRQRFKRVAKNLFQLANKNALNATFFVVTRSYWGIQPSWISEAVKWLYVKSTDHLTSETASSLQENRSERAFIRWFQDIHPWGLKKLTWPLSNNCFTFRLRYQKQRVVIFRWGKNVSHKNFVKWRYGDQKHFASRKLLVKQKMNHFSDNFCIHFPKNSIENALSRCRKFHVLMY